eukprot:12739_1
MTISQRENDKNKLYPLVCNYKSQCYYWEFLILLRRIIISMLSVAVNDHHYYYKGVLIIILLIFLLLHHKNAPFVIEQANSFESVLIAGLIVAVSMNLILGISEATLITSTTLSILAFIPFPIFLFYLCKVGNIENNEKEEHNLYVQLAGYDAHRNSEQSIQ